MFLKHFLLTAMVSNQNSYNRTKKDCYNFQYYVNTQSCLVISLQDDENHDPQWSYEQCLAANMTVGGVLIGRNELDIMSRTTVTVFEILEKSWASLDCSLIDMKIEFGVKPSTGYQSFMFPLVSKRIQWQREKNKRMFSMAIEIYYF